MKTHKMLFAAGLLFLAFSCEKNNTEDPSFAFRSDYEGTFRLVSITDSRHEAMDLNGDGVCSTNLLNEIPSAVLPESSLYFKKHFDGNYSGRLEFLFPMQEFEAEPSPISTGSYIYASNGGFVTVGCLVQMNLSQDGTVTWEQFLTEMPELETPYSWLRDGSVYAVYNQQIVLFIQEVPLYDFRSHRMTINTLQFLLRHR